MLLLAGEAGLSPPPIGGRYSKCISRAIRQTRHSAGQCVGIVGRARLAVRRGHGIARNCRAIVCWLSPRHRRLTIAKRCR